MFTVYTVIQFRDSASLIKMDYSRYPRYNMCFNQYSKTVKFCNQDQKGQKTVKS